MLQALGHLARAFAVESRGHSHPDALVRARFIEVAPVFVEHTLQVEIVVNEHVVKAFAAYRADHRVSSAARRVESSRPRIR